MKRETLLGQILIGGQVEALRAFAELLEERAIPLGLISEADRGRVFERHVLDCVRAAVSFTEGDVSAVDIGSGAGLPGIPLAVARPRCGFSLVEPKARRAGFLELAVERLGLGNVRVVRARAGEVEDRFDVATGRAFGDLEATWAAAHPLLRPGGRLIYFAGGGLSDPLARARRVRRPEPPAHVRVDPVLETSSPLVIMVRG